MWTTLTTSIQFETYKTILMGNNYDFLYDITYQLHINSYLTYDTPNK